MSKPGKDKASDHSGMMRLVRELLRPYRGWLLIIFVAMLVGVIVIVGALTFVPALALGPVVEQLMLSGT